MTLLHRLLSVIRGLFHRKEIEQDLDSELLSFVDLSASERMRDGIPPAEARRLAILELGGIEQAKERVRTYRHGALLDELGRDLHYAFRMFAKNPGFVVIVVLTLTLGIGANTAIFSLMNAVMLKSLPVREPERLVQVHLGARRDTFSNPIWEQIRAHPEVFDGAIAYSARRYNLAPGGETRLVDGLQVNGSYFVVLGIRAVIGRTFTENDDRRGCGPDGPVAVLSHGFWENHYGGAMDVLGKPIALNGRDFTIIGVTSPRFFGVRVGQSFDVATPLCASGYLDNPTTSWLRLMGRLKAGMRIEEAENLLRALQPAIRDRTMPLNADATFAKTYLKDPFRLSPAATGSSSLRDDYAQALFVLMAIAGLVLLVTCGNIASLLLARATARTREIAVRVAIGASRSRLIRQLLIESIVLGLSGAIFGILLARWASRLLLYGLSTAGRKVFLDVSLDWRVLVFTIGAGLMTGLLFGIIPAIRATHWSPAETLREITASPGVARKRAGAGRWLVSFQMGLSLVLIFGAALFLHSYWRLATADHGFTRENVLLIQPAGFGGDFGVDGEVPHKNDSSSPLYSQVLDAVRAVPGIESAAYSFTVPVGDSGFHTGIQAEGYQPQSDHDTDVALNLVSPGYFSTFGTALIAGRDFDSHDTPNAERFAIVNEAFAQKFLAGKNPVGKVIGTSAKDSWIPTEIVGLVRDAKYRSLREAAPPTIYQPASPRVSPGWVFL